MEDERVVALNLWLTHTSSLIPSATQLAKLSAYYFFSLKKAMSEAQIKGRKHEYWTLSLCAKRADCNCCWWLWWWINPLCPHHSRFKAPTSLPLPLQIILENHLFKRKLKKLPIKTINTKTNVKCLQNPHSFSISSTHTNPVSKPACKFSY